MHFAYRRGGWPVQELLWAFVETGRLVILAATPGDAVRMRGLMAQYRDAPMDLADASLVAAAEALGANRVFTLDSHFRAYRIKGTGAFEVIP
ncbi:MAG TPA: PIN domain-containing protein [Armatimonadota bacterium]|jgi:hypothetical protein